MSGKLKAVLILAVMFGLGVASGIAWKSHRGRYGFMGSSMFAEHRLKRLKSQLNLNPAQEQSLREIFQKAHERATKVNEEVSWKLAEIHRDSVQAIQKVLTPEQQREFDKLHQKYHARHHHFPEDSETRPLNEDSKAVRAGE